MKTRRPVAALALFLAVIAAGIVFAGDTEKFDDLDAVPAVIVAAVAPSLDYELAPVNPNPTAGNPRAAVQPLFSETGATAIMEITLHQSPAANSFVGIAFIGTVTASDSRRHGLLFTTDVPRISVSTVGARFYDIRFREVSAGTMGFKAWSYANNSRAGN